MVATVLDRDQVIDIGSRLPAMDADAAVSSEDAFSLPAPRPTARSSELAARASAPGTDQASATDARPEHQR